MKVEILNLTMVLNLIIYADNALDQLVRYDNQNNNFPPKTSCKIQEENKFSINKSADFDQKLINQSKNQMNYH